MRELELECRFPIKSRTVDGFVHQSALEGARPACRKNLAAASFQRRGPPRRNQWSSGAPFSIGDLATQLHLSASHLQRLFKHETGLRMGEWLITFRLQRAAYLLTNTYLSVKEIARSAGYEHVSSFIRAFERKYVLTPTRYREHRRQE